MDIRDILDQLDIGEDSHNQFKVDIENGNSLASEMTAFSNTNGGRIIVGVEDKENKIVGLSKERIHALNQVISSVASQMVHPAINPMTEALKINDKIILIINIKEGISKPYTDNNGIIWVKNGSDKRKITVRDELLRMFQEASFIHADEMPIKGLDIADIDLMYFSKIYEKMYDEPFKEQELPLPKLLANMNLATDEGCLNFTGGFCFSSKAAAFIPSTTVKAVRYPGDDIGIDTYIDNRDFSGKIEDVFEGVMGFIMNNIPYAQNGQSINSMSVPAVRRAAIEELIVNALVHRDYYISSTIRIFIFDHRMEIISPGHLPNSLTVENIKAGNSVSRNPILSTYTRYILPYRGLGNGIRRALLIYPNIEFVDDRLNNMFKVIVSY